MYQIDHHITLKRIEMAHANELFRLVDSSREHLRRWLPWVDSNRTVRDSEQFIEWALQYEAAHNGLEASIWYGGQLAGLIGLHQISQPNKSASIGYWLGESFQGKGIMTRACQAMVKHAFDERLLNRLEIRAAVGNTRSRAIPERLGFTYEGCIRQSEWLYDHYVDHLIFGLLKSEYPQQKKPRKH